VSERVLRFEQALEVVIEHAREAFVTRTVEAVGLLDSVGRVLAEPVRADRDQPPFDRSTRDGYAVRVQDTGEPLRLVGSVRAGEQWEKTLAAGEAVEIMTGAPVPAGANAVVMVEHTALENGAVRVSQTRDVLVGQNIVRRGTEVLAYGVLLRKGTVIGAAEIAVAASCGCAELPVFVKPGVAIVATGDELVELDEAMGDAQIRNSNSYALAAMVRAEGGEPVRLAVARDTREDVRARIAEGRKADLLVLSGGVSMGKYDLVEEVLAELGAEFLFTGALIQPGKPVVFGRLPREGGWSYFFGLPGNPVSTQVTFGLFVAPMLRALAGREEIAPRFVEARLAEDVKGGAKVTRFLPAELAGDWERVTVRVLGWQGSGDVAANARGNCYVVLPSEVEGFRTGETVRVLLR
jgi:molybdopterin molybdotransferase